MFSYPTGDPHCGLWLVLESSSEEDIEKQSLCTGSVGYELSKWNLPSEIYKTRLKEYGASPEKNEFQTKSVLEFAELCKPKVLILLGEYTTRTFVPELIRKTKRGTEKRGSLLYRYSGSLLSSSKLSYPHYLMPCPSVQDIWRHYDERDVTISINVARAIDEWHFAVETGSLKPLPQYNFILDPSFEVLTNKLLELRLDSSVTHLSVDIETIRPSKKSKDFRGHPGIPYTIGIAWTKRDAIAFPIWNFTPAQLVVILKILNDLFNNKIIIGQNFLGFDINFFEAFFGLFIESQIEDTMIRHHMLWPELSHKLQFLTRQYTRQPYYKDEGHGWSPRSKTSIKRLLHYNVLDCCSTFEVFEEQEEEFRDRPYLKG